MVISHRRSLGRSMLLGLEALGIELWLIIIRRRRVTFVDKEGDEHTFEVADGDNLLDIAQSEELEMEGSLLF